MKNNEKKYKKSLEKYGYLTIIYAIFLVMIAGFENLSVFFIGATLGLLITALLVKKDGRPIFIIEIIEIVLVILIVISIYWIGNCQNYYLGKEYNQIQIEYIEGFKKYSDKQIEGIEVKKLLEQIVEYNEKLGNHMYRKIDVNTTIEEINLCYPMINKKKLNNIQEKIKNERIYTITIIYANESYFGIGTQEYIQSIDILEDLMPSL